MLKFLTSSIVLSFVLFLFSNQAGAVAITLVDRAGRTIIEKNLNAALPSSVGSVTLSFLKQAKDEGVIQSYTAYEYGVVSIDEASNDVEVVSDTELRAWGWCFELNGTLPETMPDHALIHSPEDKLTWFYGYAHYREGKWIGQCLKLEAQR
jgi:hypothetical protein